MFAADTLRAALATLGALVADRGFAAEVVVIGGGALLLSRQISRPTKDLDVLAVVERGRYISAEPLPVPLKEAIADTASVHGLDPEWLNSGPTMQLQQGLPSGFATRTTRLVFGALTVQIAGRFDLICLKLYAAADHGQHSKHVTDLVELAPTAEELRVASRWAAEQDANDDFAKVIAQVVEHIEKRHV